MASALEPSLKPKKCHEPKQHEQTSKKQRWRKGKRATAKNKKKKTKGIDAEVPAEQVYSPC